MFVFEAVVTVVVSKQCDRIGINTGIVNSATNNKTLATFKQFLKQQQQPVAMNCDLIVMCFM